MASIRLLWASKAAGKARVIQLESTHMGMRQPFAWVSLLGKRWLVPFSVTARVPLPLVGVRPGSLGAAWAHGRINEPSPSHCYRYPGSRYNMAAACSSLLG